MSYVKLTDFAAKDALLSGNPSKLLRGTEIGAEFDAIESALAAAEAVNITAPIIAASTSKTTPVDADVLPILDSAAANILKKVTWANIKATLKTYFDTLYAAVGSFAATGANADITSLTALTAGGLPNNSVLTADIADAQITPEKLAQPPTLTTEVSATGSYVDIGPFPSWATEIEIPFNDISTNGTSDWGVQLVDSGGVEITGYSGGCANTAGGQAAPTSIAQVAFTNSAATIGTGVIRLRLAKASTNKWSISSQLVRVGQSYGDFCCFTKSLSGTLTYVRMTTVNGTDTFDGSGIFGGAKYR